MFRWLKSLFTCSHKWDSYNLFADNGWGNMYRTCSKCGVLKDPPEIVEMPVREHSHFEIR